MSSTAASTSNFQLILDALDDYAKQTGIDLTKNPFAEILQNCNSPDSVLQLLQDRAQAFKDYRDGNSKLVNWLSPVVQILHAFSGILSEAAGLVPFQPAKLVVVGIDTLLTAAIGVTASYDALLDLFECVGNFLDRLRVYTEIPFTPIMASIIVKILVEVLSVLALATRQIKQGRFRKFAKKLLGESEIEAVLQRLDRLTQDEARMTGVQTLEVVHGLVNNMKVVMDDGRASTDQMRQALVTIQEMTSEINKMKRDQLQKDIRSWLSPPDPSKNHNIARAARHNGTSTWFTQADTFKEWKRTGSLLWVHGKPGSGKSILSSAIIQDAEALSDAGLALVSYFYFDFKDIAKQDTRGLLTSLLAQLCAKSDPCYHVLCDLYSRHDAGSRQPDDHALTGCLEKILKLPGQPMIYIIVDALDECPNTSGFPTAREKVLELLEDLVTLSPPNLRICVTSRPEFDIRIILEPLASLHVSLHDESGQKNDILDYVSTVVHSDRRMRRWRAEDKQLVIDTLSVKADGMFRWVFCQLETLRRSLPAAIRRALGELPESLDETYEHTLLGIEKEQRDYARRLFQCLTVTVRPLRVEELAEVLAIRFDPGHLPEYHVDWRSEDPQEAVLRACSTLITVANVDGSQVVQFSHFSVKEFLTSDRLAIAAENISRFHVLPQSAHTILAGASLSVLLHLDDRVDKTTIENFPFALYAARHWVEHAQFEDVSSQLQEQMERLFDLNNPHFATWVWIYDIDLPFREPMFGTHPTRPDAVPLYYAVRCGLCRLVEHLVITHPEDIDTRGGYHSTPLHAALAKGYIHIASSLLKHGANANGLDNLEYSPLYLASGKGRLDFVELLLKHGANVNMQDGDGQTPLFQAVADGELEVVLVLLQRGATIDARDNEGSTPLKWASRNGHSAVVQLLLQRGASVDSCDNKGWTALMLASRCGHRAAVRLLLQSGAYVESRHNEGWTPLQLASQYGHLDIVQELLDHGADVRTRDHYTPLTRAVCSGRQEVSCFLIERGADVNASGQNGWTPLHFASQYGHLDTVQLLLDHGADINAIQGNLWTALHFASVNGHLSIADLLIQRGTEVDKRNEDQETALDQASGSGQLEIARLLVKCGSDVNSQDSNGWTPLHKAARNGHLEIVTLLLEWGADVDMRNSNDETSLDLASGSGKPGVALFLAERMGRQLDAILENALPDLVQSSLGRVEDAAIPGSEQGTSLHAALGAGNFDIVQSLLDRGSDVNERDGINRTPLHVAATQGKLEVARLLIKHGADVDSRTKGGWTPLHFASRDGHLDVARMLLDRGADVNAQKQDCHTPLHLASCFGHLEVIRLLLKHGANVYMRTDGGRTPTDIALRRGEREAAQLLSEHGARGV